MIDFSLIRRLRKERDHKQHVEYYKKHKERIKAKSHKYYHEVVKNRKKK